jgi:DNA polymerase elongation subunit (family B)
MKVKDIRSSKNGIYVKYENNEWKKVFHPWYFYVEKEQMHLLTPDMYDKLEVGNKFVKVFTDNFKARTGGLEVMRMNGIRTYEGDLKPEERYKFDTGIEIALNQDILYYDIETDDRNKLIEIGRDYILSWVAWDKEGNKYEDCMKELTPNEEKRILQNLCTLFKNYDICAGWNNKNFDHPYIRARAKIYDLFIPNIGVYDLFERVKFIYKNYSTVKSFSLENIAQTFLGEGKLKHTGKGTFEMWLDGSLMPYNRKDVELTKRIDETLNVSTMMILQSSWCMALPRKFSIYGLVDSIIIQKAHELRFPVRTNYKALIPYNENNLGDDKLEQVKEKYMGAQVLTPEIGYKENVYVFDFKSLYPYIMATLNIGFDTLNLEGAGIRCPGTAHINRIKGGAANTDETDTGILRPTYFNKHPSCVAETIKYLVGKRDVFKKLKFEYISKGLKGTPEFEKVNSDEIIVKELSNSVYGVMGLQFGRYYDIDVAESITLTGRWFLQFVKQTCTKLNYQVIYGDTDSVFIQSENEIDIDGFLKIFHEDLERELQVNYNVDKSFIRLNFDKHFKRMLLFGKKMYAGLCDNMEDTKVDEIFIRGLECIKRNTFKFAANAQKELCTKILRKEIPTCDVLHEVRNYKKIFFEKEFTKEELTLSVRINKEEYTGKSLSAVLSTAMIQDTGENPKGTEVPYIVVGCKKRINAIHADKYKGDFSREYYWNNGTRNLLNKVLQLVDPFKEIDFNVLF